MQQEKPQASRKKILIADDELYVRDMLRAALEDDYYVIEAKDGEEALEIASKQRPALILMDVLLPKLDGIGTCRMLKSEAGTRDILVFMMSGRTDNLDQERCKAIGAEGYVAKPFDVDELLDKIKFMLGTKQA